MQITENAIERFLNGQCTEAEAVFVSRYLRNNPEALQKYLLDNWDDEAGEEDLPEGYKELMFQEVRRRILPVHPEKAIRMTGRRSLRVAAVAASLLLAIAGFRLFGPESGKHLQKAYSAHRSERHQNMPSSWSAAEWQVNENRTDRKIKIKLEDGSVVGLLPQGKIRYAKNLAHNSEHKRDIFLQGQAFFVVAKDKDRPFTVYAGRIVTTVLGTAFSVLENERGVLVKLYSGKVKIHAERPDPEAEEKDIFLKPGEQLKFETKTNLAKVSSFENRNPLIKTPDNNTGDQGEDIVFDHSALPDVLNKLSRYYQTPIEFNKDGLSGMYFSGTVLSTDSLSIILKVIANMNDLKITKTASGFMLNSSKK